MGLTSQGDLGNEFHCAPLWFNSRLQEALWLELQDVVCKRQGVLHIEPPLNSNTYYHPSDLTSISLNYNPISSLMTYERMISKHCNTELGWGYNSKAQGELKFNMLLVSYYIVK